MEQLNKPFLQFLLALSTQLCIFMSFSAYWRAVGRFEYPERRGGGALCFERGFTQTFPGNQDVAVK